MRRVLNLPFNRVHDVTLSYGRILFPLPWKMHKYGGGCAWIGYFPEMRTSHGMQGGRTRRLRRSGLFQTTGFHNCTATGVR
jgi:hypothetical protein